MIDTAPRNPWLCCVRLNAHDKAYFARQIEGFSVPPTVLTWSDARPAQMRAKMQAKVFEIPTRWERWPAIRGGHRLDKPLARLRSLAGRAPYAAPMAERRWLTELSQVHPPSVIYAHTGFVGLRLLPVAKAMNVPLVTHFHGMDVIDDAPLYRRELAAALPDIAHVIVVGQWMVDFFEARGVDRGCISVIPMGGPVETVANAASDGLSGMPSRKSFVAISRLVGWKGVDRTLGAFAQLPERHADARLTIIGDGPLRTALEAEAARLKISDRVTFTGSLSADETLARLKEATALVHHAMDHPGGPEAFGVVITEAMALAKPVISTYCGGIPDQVIDGETGFLVRQGDVAAMSAAIARVIDAPAEAKALGAAGQKRARRLFDASKLARDVEGLLTKIVPIDIPP